MRILLSPVPRSLYVCVCIYMPLPFLFAAAAQAVDPSLLDVGLAQVAALGQAGRLTPDEEALAVERALGGDAPLLLLAKNFAALPSLETHLRAALQARPPPAGAPAAPPPPLPPPSPPPPADDMLFARRSVVAYRPGPVPAEAVQRALEAAVLAPNHFLTEPWRFYLAGPEARARLSALNAAKQAAFEKVPGWLVVTLVASDLAPDGSFNTKKGLEEPAARCEHRSSSARETDTKAACSCIRL